MFKNVRHWREHKHASVLAVGQLRVVNQQMAQAMPHTQQTCRRSSMS